MSTKISATELSWNSGATFSEAASATLSDTVIVTMSGGDGQYLFVFNSRIAEAVTIDVNTGSFWGSGQDTFSTEIAAGTDSAPVVLGPFEGSRFKNTDGTIVFSLASTGAFEANGWLNILKVPKG